MSAWMRTSPHPDLYGLVVYASKMPAPSLRSEAEMGTDNRNSSLIWENMA